MLVRLPQNYGFYADFNRPALIELPIVDKATLMAHFERFNQAGLTMPHIRDALAGGDVSIEGYNIGQSTGTSGNRGYYVISDRERFVWLGTILAKTLPDALRKQHKVALALPGMTRLYSSAASGSRIDIRFFDLARGITAWLDELTAFAPDTIVAPPKVLRFLAEAGALTASHIFSGAEVLDPIDQEIIEAKTGHIVRQIYMATEGLFGVSCEHGTLHLAEDVVKFEWQQPSEDSPLVSPVITDFTRKTQVMARYRMNDLLELSDAPCPCGSAFQAVTRIAGREDDIFHLAAPDGDLRLVTPDVIRNALIDSDPQIMDFQIVQTGASAITVYLENHLPRDIDAHVRDSFLRLFTKLDLKLVELIIKRNITTPYDKKLRRVRRDWSPH